MTDLADKEQYEFNDKFLKYNYCEEHDEFYDKDIEICPSCREDERRNHYVY